MILHIYVINIKIIQLVLINAKYVLITVIVLHVFIVKLKIIHLDLKHLGEIHMKINLSHVLLIKLHKHETKLIIIWMNQNKYAVINRWK